MLRTDKRMRLCRTLLVLILVFIWGNSLLPGEISTAISNAVKDILSRFLPMGKTRSSGGFLVRKLAHLTEFAALGACLGWLFAMLQKKMYLPFLLGVAAACMDETIQTFVPGRGPGIRDVCIDSVGVLTGIVLLHLGYICFRHHRNHLEEK